jgi:hypothetical protein
MRYYFLHADNRPGANWRRHPKVILEEGYKLPGFEIVGISAGKIMLRFMINCGMAGNRLDPSK